MESKKFFIAGVQHHHLNIVVTDLEVGDEFDLVPEPDNKFDPNAVRLEYAGVMCGYVPRKFSSEIAAALETGANLMCEITKLDPSAKQWEMCEVEIKNVGYEDEEEECEFCGFPIDDCRCADEED